MVPVSLPDEKEKKEAIVSSPKPKEATPTEVISPKQVEPEPQSSAGDPIEPMMKNEPEASEEQGQSDRDEPFVSPREVEEEILIPSPHDDNEERDEGFVVPKSEEERDLPFVPPTEGKDLPFIPPRSEMEDEGFVSPTAVLDKEDIPLSNKTLVSRWGSGKSSPRTSLNRSRGVVKGSISSNRPISINTSGGAGTGDGGHKKASPSFDSIRSQFESKVESDGNRYRRGTTTGNAGKGSNNLNRLSDVADE